VVYWTGCAPNPADSLLWWARISAGHTLRAYFRSNLDGTQNLARVREVARDVGCRDEFPFGSRLSGSRTSVTVIVSQLNPNRALSQSSPSSAASRPPFAWTSPSPPPTAPGGTPARGSTPPWPAPIARKTRIPRDVFRAPMSHGEVASTVDHRRCGGEGPDHHQPRCENGLENLSRS